MSNAAKFEVPGSGDDGKAYTYNEVGDAFALTDMASQAELDAHASDTTSVHGIADTSVLATATSVSTAVSNHAAATDPHGDRAYADGLASNYEAAGAVSTHSADTTSVHGIADTSALLDTADIGVSVQGYSAVLAATTASFTTADETKLDGIEAAADVTDETNVVAALSGATLTDLGTPASGDKILLLDASDSDNLKVAQFSTFGSGGASVPPANSLGGAYFAGLPGWTFSALGAGSALAQYDIYTFGIYLSAGVTIVGWEMFVNSGNSADVLRVGIYEGSSTDEWSVGALLHDLGTVSVSTTGAKSVTGLSNSIASAGVYQVAVVTNAAAVVPYVAVGVTPSGGWVSLSQGTSAIKAARQWTDYSSSPDYASTGLPASLSGASTDASALRVSGGAVRAPITLRWTA